MFRHIFAYRLKCLLRSRMLIFWTLLYPILLSTLFSMAFSNIQSSDTFTSIPVAVVDNAEYQNTPAFQTALNSVSDGNAAAGQKLFHVSVLTLDEAAKKLKDNKIDGYVLFDHGASVVVNNNGVGQTILKEFVDSYLQTSSAYGTIVNGNPAAAQSFRIPEAVNVLKDVPPGKTNADTMLTYFYALIAMAALFGGFWGNREITDIQADLSPQGARVNLAPVHKLKAFAYSFCASVTVQFMELVVLVAYLNIVLKLDFGPQMPFVLIACLAGSITGVSFGAFLGAISKKSANLNIAIMVTSSMLMSFLAGLMVKTVKYTVTNAVPVLGWINPANLLSDAFYSLYYYTTYTRFFINIGVLAAISVVFCLVVYLVARREKYASI